jgi:hypothetical protein
MLFWLLNALGTIEHSVQTHGKLEKGSANQKHV